MNQSLAYIIDIEIDRLQKVPSVVISQSLNSDREKKNQYFFGKDT